MRGSFLDELLRWRSGRDYSWKLHLLLILPLLAAVLPVGFAYGFWGEGPRLHFAALRGGHEFVTALMQAFSDYSFRVLLLVYFYLLMRGLADGRHGPGRLMIIMALRFALAALVCLLAVQALKAGLGMPRPEFALPRQPFSFSDAYSSFPSGHTANIVCAAVPLAVWFKRRSVSLTLAVLILAVGFSRLWLGQHHPADILGGLLLGSFAARYAACPPYYPLDDNNSSSRLP